MQVEAVRGDRFTTAAARRTAFWGPAIVGFLGVVLALNAGLSDQYTGAGACLVASALAFGVVAYVSLRRSP